MSDRRIRFCIWTGVALVAAFAFGQSYEHIYELGLSHHQALWNARLLPLSVDLLIVVAGSIIWLQKNRDGKPAGLARWMPRLMLWSGIAATIAANLAYGLPYGWPTALVSTWPGAMFAGLAETVMVAVRPVERAAINRALIVTGQPAIPTSAYEAAQHAYAASVAGGNPIGEYTLASRFGIPRSQARKIVRPAAATAALNGHVDA